MTSIQAMLLLAVGGFLFAALFGALGASLSEKNEHQSSKACFTLATFGAGTCIISIGKAALMALGV